jgi:hypothetical protein
MEKQGGASNSCEINGELVTIASGVFFAGATSVKMEFGFKK